MSRPKPKIVITIEEAEDGCWEAVHKAVLQAGAHRAERIINKYTGATRYEVQGWLIQVLATENARAMEAEMDAAMEDPC